MSTVTAAGPATRSAGPATGPATRPALRVRRRFAVSGVVQGVGFRPFVYVAATELGLVGSVYNDSAGVVVEVEGSEADLAELARRLVADQPPLARVDGIVATDLAVGGGTGFHIGTSSHAGSGRTLASPDVATCAACLDELADPGNRRYRHPFITCTNCGPRFTIIVDLPYDRPATTMAGFPMCARCAVEYADPADRRFHAQPIACPDCGPRLNLIRTGRPPEPGHGGLEEARRMLADGAVLAVKGLGGYHLMCSAADEAAVRTLRRRKRRGDKPFAVMVRDLEVARHYAVIDDREADLLASPARPIVLVRRLHTGAVGPHTGAVAPPIAASVAPRTPDLGLFLPYTPMHTLLMGLAGDAPGPEALVATSGNLAGEPIVADDDEALARLAPLVDGWLTHDRPIQVACDDSVVRVVDGEQLPLRRARGYAPLPVPLPIEVVATLATGGDLKNTCCLADGRQAWVSQHIGDMDDTSTLGAFARTEGAMELLTGVVPVRIASDAHPGYRSTAWAARHAESRPLLAVQHHHAHVASLMGEHEIPAGTKVIGMAFDGTGYGTDGAIWGGEVLVAEYAGFERFAHLGYVPLPGGDAAVHRPYRMALAHLAAAGVAWSPELAGVAACPATEAGVLAHQLATGLGCVPTSSMGRLFDAVASLAGVCQAAGYEAQAAIELEGLARTAPRSSWDAAPYRFDIVAPAEPPGRPLILDATPVIRSVVADARGGVAPADIAVRFHGAVIDLVGAVAERARLAFDLEVVGLTGGVFQNPVLLAGVVRTLRGRGFTVLRHRFVPPNDGGLALGQILVSSNRPIPEGEQPCA